MNITKDEAQMLTTLAIRCRPNGARRWDTAGVMAWLHKRAHWALPEAALMLLTAAHNADCETPEGAEHYGRLPAAVRTRAPEDPTATRCTVCGRIADGHSDGEHDFTPPRPKPDPETVAARAAAIRATLAPMSGPTERRSLEELAEANPEWHAKLERLRAGIPVPPMHESEAS